MKEKCSNHPEKDADVKCSECGKEFCGECVTNIKGRPLCRNCIDLELKFIEETDSRQLADPKSMKSVGCGCAFLILLFFVVVIGSLLWPIFKGRSESVCRRNLRNIYKTLVMYATDFDGNLPPNNNDLAPLIEWNRSRTELQWFVCPATNNVVDIDNHLKDRLASTSSDGMSYFYRGGLRMSASDKPEEKVPLVWDQSIGNHKKFVNVLYLNGDIETLKKGFPEI